MDTTKTITHVSLCAGYGGIDLGLSRAIPNLRTIAFSEIEAFACANLVAKMEAGLLDAAPIWTNLKTFPWSEFRDRVDILSGGYPCQPFSAAGKRLGKDDPRHLWPWIADGIRAMRPRICFFENVEGHISLGLREVISELEGIGYKAAWGIFSAREVGAPHQRKRVFILAYDQRQRIEELGRQIAVGSQLDSVGNDGGNATKPCQFCGYEFDHSLLGKYGCPNCEGERCGELANTERKGCQGMQQFKLDTREVKSEEARTYGAITKLHYGNELYPSRPGQPQHGWEPPRVVGNSVMHGHSTSEISETQPPLGGDSDGSASRMDYAELCTSCDNRTDELRLLGNGVVPTTAERAFRTLLEELQ